MLGGAIQSYRLIEDFLIERAEREYGVSPVIQGLIGVFHTCAEDSLASTTNLCYVGYVSYDAVEQASADRDHTAPRVFSSREFYQSLKSENEAWHWYPGTVFMQALASMPY